MARTSVKKLCLACNPEHAEHPISEYYVSRNPIHSDGKLPWCKNCIAKHSLSEDGAIINDNFKSVLCQMGKPYYIDILDASYVQYKNQHKSIPDENIKFYGKQIISLYFKNLNSLPQNQGDSYIDSEKSGFYKGINKAQSSLEFMDAEKTIITDSKPTVEKEIKVSWSEQDLKNRNYAIEVIGYDPFDGYPEESKKFLFNSISPYLEDDDNVDDAYKLSQILQIIENNMQIRVCDKKIANLDPLKNAPDIKTLSGIKNQLVQSNDKIAKENEISVKNRSNKDAGKSSLTYLMRNLREKDFDKAEADYYDQLRSPGSQWAISISQKAMLDHCMFDENDKKEVYETQLQLIDELYKDLDAKKEEIRLLLIKIDELTSKVKDLESHGLS